MTDIREITKIAGIIADLTGQNSAEKAADLLQKKYNELYNKAEKLILQKGEPNKTYVKRSGMGSSQETYQTTPDVRLDETHSLSLYERPRNQEGIIVRGEYVLSLLDPTEKEQTKKLIKFLPRTILNKDSQPANEHEVSLAEKLLDFMDDQLPITHPGYKPKPQGK